MYEESGCIQNLTQLFFYSILYKRIMIIVYYNRFIQKKTHNFLFRLKFLFEFFRVNGIDFSPFCRFFNLFLILRMHQNDHDLTIVMIMKPNFSMYVIMVCIQSFFRLANLSFLLLLTLFHTCIIQYLIFHLIGIWTIYSIRLAL